MVKHAIWNLNRNHVIFCESEGKVHNSTVRLVCEQLQLWQRESGLYLTISPVNVFPRVCVGVRVENWGAVLKIFLCLDGVVMQRGRQKKDADALRKDRKPAI